VTRAQALAKAAPWLAAAVAAVGCGGAEVSVPPAAPASAPASKVDVASQNLPIEKELDALLTGTAKLGSPRSNLRVGLVPFKVVGPAEAQKGWVGEAAAVMVAAQLSEVEGVSLVERAQLGRVIEELKRGGDSPDGIKRAAASAGVLGARILVIGSLIPQGRDRYRAVLQPVQVETGTHLAATQFELSLAQPQAVADAVRSLSATLGAGARPAKPSQELTPEQLTLAARARALQYEGRLLEAYPLYARALPAESTAWELEADYVRLLTDLGLDELAEARVEADLARVPLTKATSCARAQLLIERARNKERDVDGAREAVRAAASCGDPGVTQRALLTLAYKLEPVDFAAARATLDRSLSLKGNAWVTCHVEYERYRMRAEGELDAQGSGEARFLTIARDCAKAGNQRLAAFGFEAAARNAWNPNATTTLTAEALQHAQVIGGERLDGSLFEQAGNLRKRGQVTQADDVLVAVMGTHLKAIALAASGLPGAEKRLDDELLRRVGVERGTSPTEPAGEAGLVAQAHRRAFARALLRWADRTDLSSKVQGDYYRAIADDIDPPRVPRSSIGDDRMNKRLAVAKLPLADIARSTDPPLRGTGADVAEAFGAIYDRFFEIHADNGPTERLGELEEAARKLARWLERPRVSLRAAILQAALAQANGDWGRFAERLKAAQEITKDSPWEESRVLAWEEKWAERVDRKRVPEIRARRATLAKRTSAEDWVRQTHRAAYAAWDIGGKPFAPEVDRVLDVAKELKKVEAWEEAALAMELAANLLLAATRAPGSPDAVRMFTERVVLIAKLNDPVRTLEAKVELLAEMSHAHRVSVGTTVSTNPTAIRLMTEVQFELKTLAATGHAREAMRIGLKLPWPEFRQWTYPKQLLAWGETFKDSVEYGPLAADAYAGDSTVATTAADARASIGQSVELFLRAKQPWNATHKLGYLIRLAGDEAELWRDVDRCLTIAADKPADRVDCIEGVALFLGSYSTYERGRARAGTLGDIARQRALFDVGLRDLTELDKRLSPQNRVEVRLNLIALAASMHDLAAYDRLYADIRGQNQTSPNPGQLATAILKAADYLLEPERKRRIVSLERDFLAANGASAYWRAAELVNFARDARRAGDEASEKEFRELGRQTAARAAPRYLALYDADEARSKLEKRQWAQGAAAYTKALANAARYAPKAAILQKKLSLARAIALALGGDNAGALRELDPFLKSSPTVVSTGEDATSCLDARTLQVAAALQLASGRCDAGMELRRQSGLVKEACVRWIRARPLPEQRQCDEDEDRVACATVFDSELALDNTCRAPARLSLDALPF